MAIERTPIVDDDGSGHTGTILDAAWKDELYNQIDAYAALLGPSASIPYFTITGPTSLRTFALPDANATIFTSAGIANTALKVYDIDASHFLSIVPGSNLTADRVFTLVTGDAARTVTLSGNPTLADWFDQAVKAASSPTFNAPTVTSITIGSASIDGTDAAKIDGITNGTAAASKAMVLDSNKDITGGRHITITGNMVMGTGNAIAFTSKSRIYSDNDGQITLTDLVASSFDRLVFGTNDASGVSIVKSGVTGIFSLGAASARAAWGSLYEYFGSGTPESVVTAPVGAIYHRTNGGAGTSLYVKESGAGNTGWVGK
jgi:hypothetical protein